MLGIPALCDIGRKSLWQIISQVTHTDLFKWQKEDVSESQCQKIRRKQDRTAFTQIASFPSNCDVFGGKAYANEEESIKLKPERNMQVTTPLKLKK